MELFGLLLVLGLIAVLILPWVNMGRICSMRSDLERLRRELRDLQNNKDTAAQSSGLQQPQKKPEQTKGSLPRNVAEPAAEEERSSQGVGDELLKPQLYETAKKESVILVKSSDPKQTEQAAQVAEPQDWFSKIAVWVGGIALIMAGFYMVKYSIDSGRLTPVVRIWLTVGSGALLCVAGFVIGIKSAMAANERIGQALAGAGIACLYFAAYAAVHLYSFLSPGQGFVAMLAVTVLAVALSLKNGAPIAMMGLVGGFLTPWLMSTGSNDTVMLFSYLFLLYCGAQFFCMRRGWWALLLGSLVAAYLWSAVVIVGNLYATLDNLEGTLIFVLGICFVNAIWVFLVKQDALDKTATRLLKGVRFMTWGGGLAQGLVLVLVGGFAAVDMALFSLLSIAALVLAVLKEDDFIWAAWLALAAVAASTLSNADTALWSWLAAPFGLMGLFLVVGHWRGLSSKRTISWRCLSMAAGLLVVPLLYLNREYMAGSAYSVDSSVWLCMATIWAGLLALAGEHLYRREDDAEVAGEYAAFAVFLLGFGLWSYLPVNYLAHTAAGLLTVCVLYWKWRGFGRSVLVTSVLGVAWGALMYFHAGAVCAYFFSEEIYSPSEQDGLVVIAWALGLLGTATAFTCFRQVWGKGLRKLVVWAFGLIGLLSFVATYRWLDQIHMPESWSAPSVEGGLSALLAVLAVAFFSLKRKWEQCHVASLILASLVGLRVLVLHFFDSGAEGASFFLNALLLQFGVPLITACILAWQSGEGGFERSRRAYQLAAMLLGFIWATFLVQDYFGGSKFFGGYNSSTEIYTYSVVWLLLAISYQAIGLWRNQATIHIGSLVLLLITVGKVFLVDASELEGLFRVLSFLGLGVALIGIGFFYNKVVFARREGIIT